ncbi:NADP-dependent phosphogluconate dehydrogenase [Lactiplantibacillus carotarum]|uniref:NADP-dependent phosphogluconate dehydrogenase n=1 Tax=Lactiplantibacillus carotarum TaxID=2993456 RepID=UPI00298F3224|nr:NADP-dependent phosphogluconate dehydrogenase [Lactiplantibacillus carotarum]
MKVYLIGLGKMGYNLALNMKSHQHQVVGFDVSADVLKKAQADGFETIDSLDQLKNDAERKVIWVMLPAGKITNSTLLKIEGLVNPDDIVIDGGNSDYHDSMQRAEEYSKEKVHFMDIGTSGGTYGALHGASFMVGGDEGAYKSIEPILTDMAAEDGLLYTGKSGSGHYLKVIHNAILHSMMEVMGEGFDLLHASPFNYDLKDVAYTWNKSAVIRGWLMELMYQALSQNKKLDDVSTVIHSSSACADALKSAMELNIPIPTIGISLVMRQRTQQQATFNAQVINSLRKEVGGYRPEA